MVQSQKATGRASSIPGGLAAGALTSMVITLVLAALLAKLVQNGVMAQAHIGYGVMFLLLAASFTGAVVSQGRVKHRRLMVCMLSGAVYFLVLLSITALFFGGQYTGMGVTALLVLGGAGTAGLLTGNGGRGRGRRKRKLPGKIGAH